MWIFAKILLLLAIPVVMASHVLAAQESILLNVNQSHTLSWDWQSEGSPVRNFVFHCGQYRKDLESDARSLRFGSLVDQPGRYTGCTLSAQNEAGLSAPVIVPDFEYAYSYGTLGWLLLESVGSLCALSGIVSFSRRKIVEALSRQRVAPLALPEPVIILRKERDYVHHDSH